MLPSTLVLNIAYFRQAFPEFGNPNPYPDTMLNMYWTWATFYVSDQNWGWLRNKARQHCLNLMTAHLLQVHNIGKSGEVPGIITEATVDKVDVKLEPPPLPNQWQFWLGTTVYGQQVLALLQGKAVGGMYYGGPPVLAAFNTGGYGPYGRYGY